MANIIFPRKEIEKHFPLDENTLKKINMLGIPTELSYDSLEVEIFPNRPDLISMQGFIRAIKAFLDIPITKNFKINGPEKNYSVKVDKSVKVVRPYTVCSIVKNLSLNDVKIKEIINLQEKLHATLGRNRKKVAIGIYPLEKIKLPIKYEAKKPENIKFQPLDFPRELSSRQILQKHPSGKEYSHLLENYKVFPIFSDANNKILSMPPIINSQETGKITQKTKEIFIECSGHDPIALNKTLNIIVTTLLDMNGKVFQISVNNQLTPNLNPEKIKLNINNVNSLLGLNLTESQISKLLEKMQIEYKNKTATIPAWRTDILHEVDIIEDIAIAYGYQNFLPEIPKVPNFAQECKSGKLISKISEILIGLKLQEISTFHLIKQNEAKLLNLKDSIEILDSKTDYKLLRPNLLIPALRILSENLDNDYPQKLFEIGAVFTKEESKIKESTKLLIIQTPGNFTEIKQALDYLTQSLNIQYKLQESVHTQLIKGRTADILIDNKPIGYLGELHPQTLHNWHLKLPAAVLEISLDEIFRLL